MEEELQCLGDKHAQMRTYMAFSYTDMRRTRWDKLAKTYFGDRY
jgi:hypothetical protein